MDVAVDISELGQECVQAGRERVRLRHVGHLCFGVCRWSLRPANANAGYPERVALGRGGRKEVGGAMDHEFDATLILWLNLVGTFVFGLSGGLAAVRARLGVFGVLVLARVVGFAGGDRFGPLLRGPPAAVPGL